MLEGLCGRRAEGGVLGEQGLGKGAREVGGVTLDRVALGVSFETEGLEDDPIPSLEGATVRGERRRGEGRRVGVRVEMRQGGDK